MRTAVKKPERRSADEQNQSELVAYKHSNGEYDDSGNDDISKRRNPKSRSYPFSEDNGDDYVTEGSNTDSRYSESRDNSNLESGRSGSVSQQNNRTNGYKNGRHSNSTGGRKKADVNISNDDNSNNQSENTDMRDIKPNSSNNTFSSKNKSNKTRGVQQVLRRQTRSLRIGRETYNVGGDGVSAVSTFPKYVISYEFVTVLICSSAAGVAG